MLSSLRALQEGRCHRHEIKRRPSAYLCVRKSPLMPATNPAAQVSASGVLSSSIVMLAESMAPQNRNQVKISLPIASKQRGDRPNGVQAAVPTAYCLCESYVPKLACQRRNGRASREGWQNGRERAGID